MWTRSQYAFPGVNEWTCRGPCDVWTRREATPPAPPPAPQNPPTQVDTQPPAGNTTPTPATGTGGTVGGGKVESSTTPAARQERPKNRAGAVGFGYRGGVVDVPMDEARQNLIREVEANKFNRAKLTELFGDAAKVDAFMKRKAGGAMTPNAVIAVMGWDADAPRS